MSIRCNTLREYIGKSCQPNLAHKVAMPVKVWGKIMSSFYEMNEEILALTLQEKLKKLAECLSDEYWYCNIVKFFDAYL